MGLIDDPFSYLADLGWPMERLQRYINDRIPLDEVAAAVENMLARGMTVEEILAEDCGETVPEETPRPTLNAISAADLQKQDIPPVRWVVQDLFPAGLMAAANRDNALDFLNLKSLHFTLLQFGRGGP